MASSERVEIGGLTLPVYSLNTVVVGSGAAGLACAARLVQELARCGVPEPASHVALLTEGIGRGTSHNAGSDKQTYYKPGTHPSEPDTPRRFAETLTAAGCAHGDVALVEALNSLRCFHYLVEIGVPFPHDEYGGFVGYKTDFDPCQRATSAGPWTSRFMVRRLLAEVRRAGVRVLDRHYMLALVKSGTAGDGAVCGLLCCDVTRQGAEDHGLALFNCRNVVVAGGGPGELYELSVYPRGQMGPYAQLLEAGAVAHNLTELQFGIASLQPRWNLSGTYQQVIPRYYSTDREGGQAREFLNPWFDSMEELATSIFLKGYQWPFDPEKLPGSSLIDVLVQRETVECGRRVFIDYRRNPVASDGLAEFALEGLGGEAREYLARSGADQATPIQRLAHMNRPAVELYRQMGVDLAREPLEIGVCCQHCNGGFAVDRWWESTVPHLFVIGELAGTHGVKRPGGSALNAGQVGALRAAQRIAHVYHGEPVALDAFSEAAGRSVEDVLSAIRRVRDAGSASPDCPAVKADIQRRMTSAAGMVRSRVVLEAALQAAEEQWREVAEAGIRQEGGGYLEALKVRELALAQRAFLESVRALLDRGAGSRGSHLVTDPDGTTPHPELGEQWRFLPENRGLREEILGVRYDAEKATFRTEVSAPRPLPEADSWFENTWAEFRRGEIFGGRDSDSPRPYEA